jgi:hypothetical protein
MLRSTNPLGLWQAGCSLVDLVEESLQEAGTRVRGDLTRIVPRVHHMSGDGRAKRALLGS